MEFGDLEHFVTKAKTWYVKIFRNISRFSLCCRVWPRVASAHSEQNLRNVEDIPGYTWIYPVIPGLPRMSPGCHRHPILPEIRASRVVRPRAANAALVGAKTVNGPWCRLVPLGAACHSWSATGIHWHPLASTGIHWHPLASTGPGDLTFH